MDTNSNRSDPDPSLFSSLCGLVSFVTNNDAALTFSWKLAPAEVTALSALVSSAEISQLTLGKELPPGAGAQLGSAIKRSGTIRAISLGESNGYSNMPAPELLRMLAAAASVALERISIEDIDMCDEQNNIPLCDCFGLLTGLRSLTIELKTMYSFPLPLFIAGIGKLLTLESLAICSIGFSTLDDKMLSTTLKDLPLISDIRIEFARVQETVQTIAGLVALRRIRRLNLFSNQMMDRRVVAMVDTILSPVGHRLSDLQSLDLSYNEMGPKGAAKVAELISRSPHLQTLSMSRNPLGEPVAATIGKAILSGGSIRELDVTGCGLGSGGVVAFMESLRDFPVLSVLRIGWNRCGDLGARAVAQFLMSPGGSRLIELRLDWSGINEEGALELAPAFAKAYALRTVIMSGNTLGPRGAAAVLDALAVASAIPMEEIHFACCAIGNNGAFSVGNLISFRGCKCIQLSSNEVGVGGVEMIADSASSASACMIECLNLADNPLGDQGVKHVFNMILKRHARTLDLDIRSVGIGVGGAMAVKRIVKKHGMPYRLHAEKRSGDKKVDGIMGEVARWEHDSKPAGNAILHLC